MTSQKITVVDNNTPDVCRNDRELSSSDRIERTVDQLLEETNEELWKYFAAFLDRIFFIATFLSVLILTLVFSLMARF